MKALAGLLFALCLVMVQPGFAADAVAPAEAPELAKLREALRVLEANKNTAADAFLSIYEVFTKGEELAEAGEVQNAKTRYAAALAALETMRKLVPEWNPSIVQYRIKKAEERLAALNPDRHRAEAVLPTNPETLVPKFTPAPPVPAPPRKDAPTFQEENRERAAGRRWIERQFNQEKLYVVRLVTMREVAGS
jgi:hypothetical protein